VSNSIDEIWCCSLGRHTKGRANAKGRKDERCELHIEDLRRSGSLNNECVLIDGVDDDLQEIKASSARVVLADN